MIKNKKNIKHSFTLLELIVSMGIFSILMLMLMQFFSSTQKIWTAAEKRSGIYGDARVAMDLMSSMLQTSFYQYNAVPFYIKKNDPAVGFDQIFFVSKTGTKLYYDTTNQVPTSDLFEVFYKLDNVNSNKLTLKINMIGDDKKNSYIFMNSPPDYTNLTSKLNSGTTNNADGNLTDPRTDDIINYVTGLTFTPYLKDNTNGLIIPTSPFGGWPSSFKYFPYAVQIKLTMIDKDTYKKWKALGGQESQVPNETAAAAKAMREENQRTFTRMVYLGDRNE